MIHTGGQPYVDLVTFNRASSRYLVISESNSVTKFG